MMKWLMEEESGQGMVEYGLILAFISVLAIAAIKSIGTKIKTNFEYVNTELTTP